jgi:hypothetical protein
MAPVAASAAVAMTLRLLAEGGGVGGGGAGGNDSPASTAAGAGAIDGAEEEANPDKGTFADPYYVRAPPPSCVLRPRRARADTELAH